MNTHLHTFFESRPPEASRSYFILRIGASSQKSLSSAFQSVVNIANSIAGFAVRLITAPFVFLASLLVLMASATIFMLEVTVLSLAALPFLIVTAHVLAMVTVATMITGMTLAMIFIPPLLIMSVIVR